MTERMLFSPDQLAQPKQATRPGAAGSAEAGPGASVGASAAVGAPRVVHLAPRRSRAGAGWRLGAVSLGLALAMVAVAGRLVITAGPSTVPAANAAALPEAASVAASVGANGTEQARSAATPSNAERAGLPRAAIVDRNGTLLADSVPVYSLYARPGDVPDAVATAAALADAFPWLDQELIEERLARRDGEFVYLARHLTPRQFNVVRYLGLPGVQAQREYRRVYPQGRLAAHVVGLTRSDHTALSGVELFYDAELVSQADTPMQLSLDAAVQAVVRQELQAQIDAYAAAGGAGIVMDVRTGELLASVSLPDFDPNEPGKRNPVVERNRVTNDVYELGSVFKPIVAAVALDTRAARVDSEFDARRPIRVDGHWIHDFHGKARWLSMPEVLIHSSNIGAARMASDIGTEQLVRYYQAFGLLDKAGVQLPEVQQPLLPASWQDINAMTTAYGYGMSVSPVQFVSAFAALVNGGMRMQPTLTPFQRTGSAQGERVIKKSTSAAVRWMLRQVVEKGTGRNADTDLYPVGGKTGTALKEVGGEYSRDKRISSFVGAYPIESPRYAVMVMVDEPKEREETGRYATGGKVAAPAVKRIVERTAPMLGVKPHIAEPEEDSAGALVASREGAGGGRLIQASTRSQ